MCTQKKGCVIYCPYGYQMKTPDAFQPHTRFGQTTIERYILHEAEPSGQRNGTLSINTLDFNHMLCTYNIMKNSAYHSPIHL